MVNADSRAYRVGRELGKRTLRSFAAIREPNELVVVQRFAAGDNPKLLRSDGVITLGVDAMNQLLRDAECLARNWHPNIARVKHVDGDAMKLTIATELVDGVTLGDLFAARTSPLLPHAVIVRVLVDVLAGLNALHALRDGTRAVGTIHGAVCPANIVVGRDGVARIVSCLRPRPVRVEKESETLAYAAPEALDDGGTKDGRADIYAVGVILWQGLMGMQPYEASDPVQLLARQRSEEVLTPPVDAASTFAGLGEIAIRAMAFEPSLRYRTTAEMAAALRTLAGAEIATGTVVAAKVAELAGDRIRARRAELDPKSAAVKRRAPESAPAVEVGVGREVEAPPVTARGEAVAAPTPAPAKPDPYAGTRATTDAVATGKPQRHAAANADAPTPALPASTPRPADLPSASSLAAVPVIAPLSSASSLAAVPVIAPLSSASSLAAVSSSSQMITSAALFQPGIEPTSLSASEAPPPRRRRSRAAVLLLLGTALVILLVAGVRILCGNDRDSALAGAPRATLGAPPIPTPPPPTGDAPTVGTRTTATANAGGATGPAATGQRGVVHTPSSAARVERRPAAKNEKKSYDPLGI